MKGKWCSSCKLWVDLGMPGEDYERAWYDHEQQRHGKNYLTPTIEGHPDLDELDRYLEEHFGELDNGS